MGEVPVTVDSGHSEVQTHVLAYPKPGQGLGQEEHTSHTSRARVTSYGISRPSIEPQIWRRVILTVL